MLSDFKGVVYKCKPDLSIFDAVTYTLFLMLLADSSRVLKNVVF